MFIAILLLLPGQNMYQRLLVPELPAERKQLITIPTPAPYPLHVGLVPAPVLTASAVIIVDVSSAMPIFEKNADIPLHPASTTKIMTALVTLDYFNPDDIVVVKAITKEGRVMGLKIGEKISVESLLYGMLVHSANDAAIALASVYPGGLDAFVSAMNKKASDLHLTASHFTNPVGFDDSKHRMSARDLARLSMVALKNHLIAKMVSTKSITVSDVTYTYFHPLVNVNELLGKVSGVAGFKTGYTQEAGESMVTFLVKPHAKLVFVVLGSDDRFGETEKLITWALNQFTWVTPAVQEVIGSLSVEDQTVQN